MSATYTGPALPAEPETTTEDAPREISPESREWARSKSTSAVARWAESRAGIRAELRAAGIM